MGRPKSFRKTVVVGAGPVGSLAALYAADRGDQVEVYELRSDIRTASPTATVSKSINLALSDRGVSALRESGHADLLDHILTDTIPMYGRMVHTKTSTGKFQSQPQAYDGVNGKYQRSVDRNELNKHILDKLTSMPNVTLHFQHKLTGADLKHKVAWFEDQTVSQTKSTTHSARRPEHEVHFDLLIGADGAHSAARYYMMKFANMDYSQSYIDSLWCEFDMSADPSNQTFSPEGYRISPNHLHIWPAGSSMFIALPTFQGKMVCTLFGPQALFTRLETAAKAPNSVAFTQIFDDIFPGVTDHIRPQDLIAQFQRNPHLPLISIRTSPHHFGTSCVLLGDAANAMVPFYGQGMNCGLESVQTLFSLLDRSKESQSRLEAGFHQGSDDEIDWTDPEECLRAALAEYSHVRVPDSHAIVDLAMGNYQEMASGVVSRRYKARKWLEEGLEKWMPWLGWRTQYARVSFGGERYSRVIERSRWQGRVLNTVIDGLGLGVAGVGMWYAWRFTGIGRRIAERLR